MRPNPKNLVFGLLATTAIAAAVSCSPPQVAPFTKLGTGGGPQKDTTPNDKALPALQDGDQKVRIAVELMRMRRSSLALAQHPEANKALPAMGCIQLDTTLLPTRYLRATYNCQWKESGAGSALQTSLIANEDYSVTKTSSGDASAIPGSEAKAVLSLRETRLSKPPVVLLNTIYNRDVIVTPDIAHADGSYAVTATSGIGKKEDKKTDYWKTSLVGWWDLHDQVLQLEMGAEFQMSYQAAQVGNAPQTLLTVVLDATGPVTFRDTEHCPVPLGQFRWANQNDDGTMTAPVLVDFRADGIFDEKTKSLTAYPADSCADFQP